MQEQMEGFCHKFAILVCILATGVPVAQAANTTKTHVKQVHLPFTIAGTVITAKQKSVLIRPEKETAKKNQKNIVEESWLHEGESFQDYKIIAINKGTVLFSHKGKEFTMRVGYGRFSPRTEFSVPVKEGKSMRGRLLAPTQAITPALQTTRDKEIKAKFIPPPENIEAIRTKAQTFLNQLRKNPQFMKKVEEMRPVITQDLKDASAARTPAAGAGLPGGQPDLDKGMTLPPK